METMLAIYLTFSTGLFLLALISGPTLLQKEAKLKQQDKSHVQLKGRHLIVAIAIWPLLGFYLVCRAFYWAFIKGF